MSAILLIALAAWNGWDIEHMDIANAYVNEGARYHILVHVTEPMNANGTFSHGGTMGFLQWNLWGGK